MIYNYIYTYRYVCMNVFFWFVCNWGIDPLEFGGPIFQTYDGVVPSLRNQRRGWHKESYFPSCLEWPQPRHPALPSCPKHHSNLKESARSDKHNALIGGEPPNSCCLGTLNCLNSIHLCWTPAILCMPMTSNLMHLSCIHTHTPYNHQILYTYYCYYCSYYYYYNIYIYMIYIYYI